MIAKTLLTPEDSTNAGVRFQFVQNEVIRVQEDDLIAVLTEMGWDSSCYGQLVSVRRRFGSDALTVDIRADTFNINDTLELPRSGDFGFREVDPAIKAYVSGMYTRSIILIL